MRFCAHLFITASLGRVFLSVFPNFTTYRLQSILFTSICHNSHNCISYQSEARFAWSNDTHYDVWRNQIRRHAKRTKLSKTNVKMCPNWGGGYLNNARTKEVFLKPIFERDCTYWMPKCPNVNNLGLILIGFQIGLCPTKSNWRRYQDHWPWL